MTPNQKRTYLYSIGYEFIPNKQDNGYYKIDVWINDSFYKSSNSNFECWHDGINKIVSIFYDRYKDKDKEN